MKLPQLALRKVSRERSVMTVCESSLLVAPGGKDAKRDIRRSQVRTNCDFGRMWRRRVVARFYKRQSLCTRLSASRRPAGLLRINKPGFFEPSGRFSARGMRAAAETRNGISKNAGLLSNRG
jgi:hypothetical protein